VEPSDTVSLIITLTITLTPLQVNTVMPDYGIETEPWYIGTVHVFRQKITLEDAIGSHACSLQANMRVTNGIPLGSFTLLPVDTVNCVATLKARSHRMLQLTH
jgi:hypothetical protein